MDMDNKNSSKKLNGWNEWGKYVLLELERQNEQIQNLSKSISNMSNSNKDDLGDIKDDLIEKINHLEVEFKSFRSRMEVKSGIWGLIGGMIPPLAAIIFLFLKGIISGS